MASRRSTVALAYTRPGANLRGATHVDRHSMLLIVGLLTLATFAGVLYLSQASVATELRFALMDREYEAQQIWEHNLIVRRDIADHGRLAAIEERAARLGMVTAPSTEPHLVCAVPPSKPVPAPLASAAGYLEQAPQEPSGLWEQLIRRLGLASLPASGSRIVLNAANP